MKKFFYCFVSVLFVFPFFSFPKDVMERTVQQMNSWQESFDIDGKKEGKYNIMVTVADKGGNQTIGGPYNIFIDPDSDYPVTSITNPLNGMRVPDNLNIVGTCVDDDAVDHVELILDGDTKNPVRAAGKEFWSYYLDTTKLSEGPHTIDAYGIDVNGLQGKPIQLMWNLDRRAPETSVTNYSMGTLVSGTIYLKGTIADGNGIKKLFYSPDNGQHFREIKIVRQKNTVECSFDFSIDTRKMVDGPAVVWFKAVDRQNTEGIYTFLCFVDNTKPAADIIWPPKNTVQSGTFSIAGYARDTIGVTKLSWVFGDKHGDFDLVPGNPYWYREFDATGIKTKNVLFSISAQDAAGNVTVVSRRISLDENLDKPVVSISNPEPESVVEGLGSAFLRGLASDDDGVASIEYSLDNGPEQSVETHGVFCVTLNPDIELSAGKHTVTVTPVDITGVKGNPVSVVFSAKGSVGHFTDAQIRKGKNNDPVHYGIQINPQDRDLYETEVSADCGIASVKWKFESSSGSVKEGEKEFRKPVKTVPVALPLFDAPSGVTTLAITAIDAYGRTIEQKAVLGIGTVAKETGFIPVDMPPEPPAPEPGDTEKPVLKIVSPENQSWVTKTVEIRGTVSDAGGIRSVRYSVDNRQNWFDCKLARTSGSDSGAVFSAIVPLSEPDGLLGIDVEAADSSGNTTELHRVLQKDTTPPDVQVVLPAAGDTVNGRTLVVLHVKDSGRLADAEYAAPEEKGKEPVLRKLPLTPLVATMVGTDQQPIDEAMSFRFTDEAGNTTSVQSWQFFIDSLSDLPRAEILIPAENEVITHDFKLSGVLYDDDGPARLYYKIDDGPYTGLPEANTSFAVDIPLASLTDNEHTITTYAVDVNGTKGAEITRKIRVSLEEPKASVIYPDFDRTVSAQITMTGKASDKNGIEKIQVSLDNGNSWNDAVGTENWTYAFDTRVIKDGSHAVFIKVFDSYGIQGLYSSLINIDNTKPELDLDLPLDGMKTFGPVFVSGNTIDNIGVKELYVSIHALDKTKPADGKFEKTELQTGLVLSHTFDLSELDDGIYNMEVASVDKAGNTTVVSRNIKLDKTIPPAKVDLLYPLNGQHLQGIFNLYGSVVSRGRNDTLTLIIDGKNTDTAQRSDAGYFKFTIRPDMLSAGEHTYKVRAVLDDGSVIDSAEQTFVYKSEGPWVTIENFTYGDFAIDRPYLNGLAGYTLSEDDLVNAKSKEVTPEERAAIAAKAVRKVEISFDNGRTFTLVSRTGKWRYRIENDDLQEGYHFLLVRATMKNGEIAVTRTIVQIDKTKPVLRLISPGEGGRFNHRITFSGLSSDNVGLKRVTLALRQGDKAAYEIPAFIQGLYLDWHFWGATLFDVGVGLTFFDDNVKLQFQWGQFTQAQRDMFKNSTMRYGGDNVMGIKILANVGYMPFRYLLGPDWDWLAASFAVGANFTRFNETNSGKAQILSALLGQIEFPRITFPQVKRFKTFSLYTEFQLWFIPTDVSSTSSSGIQNLVPQISEGIRLNVF